MSAICSWLTSGWRPQVSARSSPIQPAPMTATLIWLIAKRFYSGKSQQQAVLVVDARQDPGRTVSNQDHVFDAHAGAALDVGHPNQRLNGEHHVRLQGVGGGAHQRLADVRRLVGADTDAVA